MRPDWSPVECLSITDCFSVKLLANSDRWADRQVLARDLIDLAALRRELGPVPKQAWSKAERAYKAAVRKDLRKAIAQFSEDAGFRKRCFEGLKIEKPSLILEGLSLLTDDLRR